MRFLSAAAAASVLALGLAACTASPTTSATQMAPAAAGSASAAPQTANSLPRGDVVNAPRAPASGVVSNTRTY